MKRMFWHGWTRTRPTQDDLATDDPYQFQPLSASTTIRLIKVLPEKVKGCIACRIAHFDGKQQEAIKYHALSYVWGEAESTRQVYLQGQGNVFRPFPLHENLWQFLDHTWRAKHFDQWFWTDYLCLNQKGPEEISQQVPRMNAIYRNAKLVVIWLRLEKDEREGLRRLVRWLDRIELMPKVVYRIIQQRLPYYQDAIRGAMNNPYWRRVWIVQEVVVAEKVCVTTEDMSVDLDELRVLVDTFVDAKDWAQRPSMWLLCDMRAVGGRIPLWRILRDFKRYQSSRPVDRVFGMLGMVEDCEDGSSPAENIQVDYDQEMWLVLLDVMFESSLPLAEYRRAEFLVGKAFRKGFELLKRYIGHSKTTARHRNFGRIALQAFEAFSIIKWVPRAPLHSDVGDLTDDLFSSAANTDWKPTLKQSAALIGLLLSRLNKGALPTWITHRKKFEEDRTSPWRCGAHGSHDGDRSGLGSYEVVARVSKTWIWGRGSVVNACGQQSKSCNGSVMACEISDIGLRLNIQPGISPADACYLSLHSLKTEN